MAVRPDHVLFVSLVLSCWTVNCIPVTQMVYLEEPSLSLPCCQVIELCRQIDIYCGPVERLLSCLHSPSDSANSRAQQFVQAVTVKQLIPGVWHKVMWIIWTINCKEEGLSASLNCCKKAHVWYGTCSNYNSCWKQFESRNNDFQCVWTKKHSITWSRIKRSLE